MRWVLLVFVASCYAPSPYSNCGVTCATNLDCPTGLSCFDNRCSAQSGQCGIDAPPEIDAAIDAITTGDSDGDGIPNAMDKCPNKPSQDNRDHDGDGLGDICDPCPMFTDNTNSDSDAIGDACDPRPANGADVATFYGFYTAAEYATWPQVGNWSFTNGMLVGSNIAMGGAFFETPTNFGGNVAVYAEIDPLVISSSTSLEKIVGVSARRTGGFFEGCQVAMVPANGNVLRVRKYTGAIADNSANYTGMISASHPIKFMALDTTDICRFETESISGAGVVVTGRAGIDVSFMDIAVDYLFVVTMN